MHTIDIDVTSKKLEPFWPVLGSKGDKTNGFKIKKKNNIKIKNIKLLQVLERIIFPKSNQTFD